MSNISNRFYVSALADGTTLHGNLSVDGTLTQAWNGTTAVPDWSIAANQPTIFLTLLSGNKAVTPTNNFQWFYNGIEIEFGNGGVSTNPSGLFQKTTYTYIYDGESYSMPALKIRDNLASSSNVDIDTITFSGEYVESGSSLPFSASIQARISMLSEGSSLGVISFVNGKSDILQQSDVITMYGTLFNSQGVAVSSNVTTKWYLNDSSTGVNGQTKTIDGTTYTNAYQVTGSNTASNGVVDHATIRCDFYEGQSLTYTAYAFVDDMQDPEYMYIQYNGNNGNAASLRKSDPPAPFQVWVGSRDNIAVRPEWVNATYKVQLLDGSGNIISASGLSEIPNPDTGDTTNYYRTLNKNSQNKAYFSIAYDTANAYGKNITGIIIATN